MKNLVLASLMAIAASQAAGCIISSGDDGGGSNAYLTANWSIQSVASGTVTPCPAGYGTAALYSQPVDANGNNNGTLVIDLFNCADGTGTSAPLPPTMIKAWVQIENDNNSSDVFATSLAQYEDLTVNDQSFTTKIYGDGGYFQFAWSLVGESSGSPLDCTSSGATGGIEAIGTEVNNSTNSASDIFTCTDGSGITDPYVAATYTVSVDALNSSMQSIGTAPALNNKVINSGNAVTDLGTVSVPITGL